MGVVVCVGGCCFCRGLLFVERGWRGVGVVVCVGGCCFCRGLLFVERGWRGVGVVVCVGGCCLCEKFSMGCDPSKMEII